MAGAQTGGTLGSEIRADHRPYSSAALSVLTATTLLAGCGDAAPEELDEVETLAVAEANVRLITVWRDAWDRPHLRRDRASSARKLIEICRDNADAVYRELANGNLVPLPEVLEQAASILQPFEPELAARLRGIAEDRCE